MNAPNPLTARALVLGAGRCDHALAAVAREHDHGRAVALTLSKLTSLGVNLVCDEVGAVADRLLDLDVTDVVAHSWERHREIERARLWTKNNPTAEVVVPLATHTVVSGYHPWVDVLVEEVPTTRIELALELAITVDGALVALRGGAVDHVRAGRLNVRGSFSCEGVRIAERHTVFDLPTVWARPDARAMGVPQPQYRPGDIVNGHVLNATGTAWEPLDRRR